MGLRLTNTADYAIRAMVHLACQPAGTVCLKDEVAGACKVPASFLAKILRRLVRADLLSSTRGAKGGFRLARDPATISLLEVVGAIEGPLTVAPCTACPCNCPWCGACPADAVWREAQQQVERVLAASSLDQLAERARERLGGLTERLYEASNAECIAGRNTGISGNPEPAAMDGAQDVTAPGT